MHRIFVGLAAWILIIFLAEFMLGLMIWMGHEHLFGWHMLGGLFLGTFVCIVHIMVLFHFVGSGKEMEEASEVLGESEDIVVRVKKLKSKVRPYAYSTPLLTGAAVILGGGAHTGATPSWIHWVLGILALLLNLAAFPVEYKALKVNLDMIREIDRRLKEEISPAILDDEESVENSTP